MNDNSNVGRYKVDVQKPITFLCTINEQVEVEIENTVLLH